MKALLIVLLFSAACFGQMDGNPENWCREGFFTRDTKEFSVGQVSVPAGSRAYFYSDDSENCPQLSACRKRSYLVRDDEVIVNRVREGFACVWYSPAKGYPTVAWMKTSDLSIAKPRLLSNTKDWLGEWTYGDNGIQFTDNKLNGFLNVTGDATWRGIGANVHVGEIDGRYAPENGAIEYSDGDGEFDCKMTMHRVGLYLVVGDNLKCGGVNVTFSGVYIRKGK